MATFKVNISKITLKRGSPDATFRQLCTAIVQCEEDSRIDVILNMWAIDSVRARQSRKLFRFAVHVQVRRVALVAISIATFEPGTAQAQADWATFTSMREINGVQATPTSIWAATSGGVLRYNSRSRRYDRFTTLDGLAGNEVLSVAHDDRGDLWFGTRGAGLCRFRIDSETFDAPFLEFRGLSINALLVMGNQLLVGTDEGVSVFDIDREEVRETYSRFGTLLDKNTPVTALTISEGVLCVATGLGIAWADLAQPNLKDPNSWDSATFTGEVSDVLAVNGRVYLAAERGIFSFAPTIGTVRDENRDIRPTSLSALEGRPVAAAAEGYLLRREEDGQWARLPGGSIADVRGMSSSGASLWLGTGSGLRVIGERAPSRSREPAANRFFDMEVLDTGELWVATVPNDHFDSFGLYQLAPAGWTVWDRAAGMPTDDIVSLATDARGRLWAGTWGAGVSIRSATGALFRLHHQNSDLQGLGSGGDFVVISDIARDTAGNMWLVNVKFGIVVIDGFPVRRSHVFDQVALGFPPGEDLNKITVGPDGLKWLTSPTHGFGILDDGGTPFDGTDDQALFIDVIEEDRLSSNRVSDIEITPDGTLWVATDNGINRVRGSYSRASNSYVVEQWTVLSDRDGLPASQINDLELDACGNLWVATEGGLTHISPGGEIALPLTSRNSPLINNRVNSLLFDASRGQLWIGTFDGLSRTRLPDCDREVSGDSGEGGLQIYPNPFTLSDGESSLILDGIAAGMTVQIFTISGELVRRLEGTSGQRMLTWDGRNDSGFPVSSGIYVLVADDGAGKRIRGRFAVVRP